jgi:hypothetical protein
MALYLKKLAIYNTVSEEVTQLVNVMEGAEGSAVFGYNVTDSALTVANGQKTQFKQTHTVSLSILPPSGSDATIMDGILNSVEPLPVKIAGMSDDVFLLWDEQSYLVQKDEYGDTLTRNLNATKDATIGYRGTAPLKKKPVYAGGNLLALYDVLTGSASALNGFTVLNGATGSVTGAAQTITLGSAGGWSMKEFLVGGRDVQDTGVDFAPERIGGLRAALAAQTVLHAWRGGARQMTELRNRIAEMKQGGVVALHVPKAPFRCPPGPYERVSLIAHYLSRNNPKAKLLLFDANPDILANVSGLEKPPFCVGFAAESENLEEYAELKRKRKHQTRLHTETKQHNWTSKLLSLF